MQIQQYDTSCSKQTTHLSINSDLLRQAKELKINLSQTFERSLALQVQEVRRQHWQDSSHEAIEEYSRFVEEHGCFGDKLRSF